MRGVPDYSVGPVLSLLSAFGHYAHRLILDSVRGSRGSRGVQGVLEGFKGFQTKGVWAVSRFTFSPWAQTSFGWYLGGGQAGDRRGGRE